MNCYLVERYLPGVSEADLRAGLRRAQAACAELEALGAAIRYRGSVFLALEETCFCRFDSDRSETVADVNARARLPFARITAGLAIDPEQHIAPAAPPPEAAKA